ncbi:hypothetical protein BJ875DRAFT_434251 [Amylocarpus encephaloides]|uniref:Oxidoreductase n=1 Tax=Amylocarpus encephaloides TaxID=45428 RepID=A0A9P7Y902_9HELO|nr:hypothetical protein BJ875DRAFT_434251 [Amylocarpus encephaloides]
MLYGFLSRPAIDFDTEKDIPNLTGKVIAITGGNAGLGAETVLRLAPHNPAHIYILSRNASSTSSTISEVKSQVPTCCPISHVPCDLSSLSSVRDCATELKRRTQRLDIVFLNAGVMLVPPALTEDGYDIQFGTNHLGHFLLSELLLPLLRSTAQLENADVRVVVLSSAGMALCLWWGIDYNTLKKAGSSWSLSGLYRYGQSKLANALFAREFDARYARDGITCVSIHPGVISTGLWSAAFGFASNWGRVADWIKVAGTLIPVMGFEGAESGAKGQLWGAVGRKGDSIGEVKGGEFYTPVGIRGQGTWASMDMGEARKLWEWSAKEVAKYMK